MDSVGARAHLKVVENSSGSGMKKAWTRGVSRQWLESAPCSGGHQSIKEIKRNFINSLVLASASTAISYAGVISAVIESDSGNFGSRTATKAINGDGLTGDKHDTNSNNMWLSATGATISDQFVVFDLGTSLTVNSFQIWNYNEGYSFSRNYTNRGVNGVTISFSDDNISYTPLAGVTNFAEAPLIDDGLGNPDSIQPTDQYVGEIFNGGGDDFTSFTARYVRFDVESSHGDPYVGLSEVQFRRRK